MHRGRFVLVFRGVNRGNREHAWIVLARQPQVTLRNVLVRVRLLYSRLLIYQRLFCPNILQILSSQNAREINVLTHFVLSCQRVLQRSHWLPLSRQIDGSTLLILPALHCRFTFSFTGHFQS